MIYCDLTDPLQPVTHIEVTTVPMPVSVSGPEATVGHPFAVQYFPVGTHQIEALKVYVQTWFMSRANKYLNCTIFAAPPPPHLK